MNIEKLIDARVKCRSEKRWDLCDEIRDMLDSNNVFVFDTKAGPDIYYLPLWFFKFKDKMAETIDMSKRQYVEYIIQRDLRAEKNFNAWLVSVRNSNKSKQ